MRQLISITIIGILIIFLGCKTDSTEKSVGLHNKETIFPVIIDTSKFGTSQREASWMSTANYELLYIGKWKDTIYPDYELKHFPSILLPPSPSGSRFEPSDTIGLHKRLTQHMMYPYHVSWIAPNNYKSWHEAELLIKVDTTQRVKNDDIGVNWEKTFFEAYPVVIRNLGNDTIRIAYGDFVPLITEAKDSTGIWQPIEKDWIYICGNGVGTVILPPNEIAISAAMIYHGDYLTSLRLRIDSSVSNEFKGNINYRQFESMYNSHGDYKEEFISEMNN